MAKKIATPANVESAAPAPAPATSETKLRMPAEEKYAAELAYLASVDKDPRPFAWRLSPRMIRTFILGAGPGTASIGRSRRSSSATRRWSSGRS
ncbi:hypothetical protein OV079_47875 [Nannocystis pusilla]|uniref:Uncharacterized protein n=1 Tax=Nannocystis pusilla TaxID=889268 RepID=A0A9X3F0R5_9BACT|nr:hypothetical protein [Nannocystis pusilla]MCY1013125.1 hypothetical protein [Nannocystis pusilla]